jgi:hypothetical protein
MPCRVFHSYLGTEIGSGKDEDGDPAQNGGESWLFPRQRNPAPFHLSWNRKTGPIKPTSHLGCNPAVWAEIKRPAEMVDERWGEKAAGGGGRRGKQ